MRCIVLASLEKWEYTFSGCGAIYDKLQFPSGWTAIRPKSNTNCFRQPNASLTSFNRASLSYSFRIALNGLQGFRSMPA